MPESPLSSLPRLEVFDHVDGVLGDDLDRLEKLAGSALVPCLAQVADAVRSESESESESTSSTNESAGSAPMASLEEIEVSVVSDAAIAAVHGDFMDDPSPTDVITFHHGEILISYDTACRRAAELGQPALRELLLYVIHGLLHLNGHDDHEADQRRRMHRIQERILNDVWPLPGGANV